MAFLPSINNNYLATRSNLRKAPHGIFSLFMKLKSKVIIFAIFKDEAWSSLRTYLHQSIEASIKVLSK